MELTGDKAFLHGDVFAESSVYSLILKRSNQNSVIVDRNSSEHSSDNFWARCKNDRISEIGVNISCEECYPLLPVYKLSAEAVGIWLEEIRNFIDRGIRDVYAEEAFNRRHADIALYPVYISGMKCVEVDTEEDLIRARGMVQTK